MDLTLKKCEISPDATLSVLLGKNLVSDYKKQRLPNERVGLRTDSRSVAKGDIFLAIRGQKSDGHEHLAEAIIKGAGLLILEEPPNDAVVNAEAVPWLLVNDTRIAWAHLAAAAFGNPEERLTLLAATGTNGKTSTIWMTGELLRAAGIKTVTIGTLGAFFGDIKLPTNHTTPDPDVLYGMLALAVESGFRAVALEASSHALAQGKLAPIRFSGAVFTSFSRDHLDFHPTLDAYWDTKWTLFTQHVKPDAVLGFAGSLPRSLELKNLPGTKVIYRLNASSKRAEGAQNKELVVESLGSSFNGTNLTLTYENQATTGEVPYFSTHAIENFAAAALLASAATGRLLDKNYWTNLAPVPGRLEQVLESNAPAVIVDYAHTPDALEKTLKVLRPLCRAQLIVIFGCGGDRDRGKRPLMGEIAERLADKVIITSDNPRGEDPQAILKEIAGGCRQRDKVTLEVDRGKAIAEAIRRAKTEDLILIAGKGHENSQIFADKTVPFDDRLEAKAALKQYVTNEGNIKC
jgi:UDP-N-acetylmuramoyl-L-alanyl-D-glutamate--2,6-diaminopimelate ligase